MVRPMKPVTPKSTTGPAAAEAGGILTVDLGALVANYLALKQRAAPSRCAAVVKADGYGVGLEPAAVALAKAGCKTFFVALIEEALRLRTVAPAAEIYILNGLNPGTAAACHDIDARPVLGSLMEIEEWEGFARQAGEPLPAAIHIDTGMARHGLTGAEALELADRLNTLAFKPSLIMSHLARADEPAHPMNARQIADFRAIKARFPGIPASLANSAGLLALKDSHFDLVRPGIALYGGRALIEGDNPMRAVVRLELRVVQVRSVKKGETVGYGGEFMLKHDSRIAVLSAGYADGIFRTAGSNDRKHGGEAIIAGRRCPIVGRISMDLITIDVTGVPAGEVKRGDLATLLGDGISVDDLAAHAGTIGYEVLTQLGRRFARVYGGA